MNFPDFHAEVDQATPESWSEALDLFSDANLYQTWAYGKSRAGRSALSHFLLRRGTEVVAMAQLRIAPRWPIKCGVALLRWGPVCHRKGQEMDPLVVQAMARALHVEYVCKRGLLLRILPCSSIGTSRAQQFENAFRRFSSKPFGPGETYRTLVLDLQPPLEDLRKKLDQKWRNQLNRAEKNNLRITTGEQPELFQAFAGIYEEMLARKKFTPSSDLDEFARLQQLLPEHHRLRVFICEENGVPIAGAIATGIGDTGIYLFGGTSDAGMKAKGAYVLQWAIVQWLKQLGVRYYNLGGINPDTNPGVYHFKSGLSGEDVLYSHALVGCENWLSKFMLSAGNFAQAIRSRLKKGVLI
jgi:hypothetical protein